MKITSEQVTAVSALDVKERYLHSLKMIADTEQMYSLLDAEGNWELATVEDKTLFFIWSAEVYVKPFLDGDWKGSEIEKITIDELKDEILPFLKEKSYPISFFSINNQSGFVVTADEFLRDLNLELKKYE